MPRAGLGLQAVPDGVFHERLKDQAGHLDIQGGRIDLDRYGEPVPEPDAFYLQVFFDEGDLVAQLGEGLAGVVHGQPQQFAQAHEHPIGGIHIAVHQ